MSDTPSKPWLLGVATLVLVPTAIFAVGAVVTHLLMDQLGTVAPSAALAIAVVGVFLPPLVVAKRIIAALKKPNPPRVTLASLTLYGAALLGVFFAGSWELGWASVRAEPTWFLFGREAPAISDAIRTVANKVHPAAEQPETLPDAGPPTPWNAETVFRERADSVVVVRTQMKPKQHKLLAPMLEAMGLPVFEGFGSGFFVGGEGLVVTNHHVIADVEAAVVHHRDGRKLGPVTVLAVDIHNDLALLRVPSVDGMPRIPLAAPDDISVGIDTFAIGSPLGLEHSITAGILSAKRSVSGTSMLQMETTVAPGSSGDPCLMPMARWWG